MPCLVKCNCGAEKYFAKLNADQISSFECDECFRKAKSQLVEKIEEKQESKPEEAPLELSKKEKKKAKLLKE